MPPELRRFSEYYALAKLRPPTTPLSFLGQIEKTPFIAGFSHILAADSKVGKTELMIRVVLGWPDQEVLWISEESQGVWEKRALLMGRPMGPNVRLCHAMGLSSKAIIEMVRENEWDVLVIDTIKLLQIADENDPAEVMKKLQPLLAMQQEREKVAIFLHHKRKAGGGDGLATSGSYQFRASVDVTLELSRYKKKNQRRLHGWARIQDPEDIIYALDDGELSVVKKVEPLPVQLMEIMTPEWQSTKELAEALDPEPKDAGRALKVLAKQKRIEREPPMAKGTLQGTTYYWRRADGNN